MNFNEENSRLCCPYDKNTFVRNQLFFSLVDYRNNYFTSNDIRKIIEFYNGFENRDQLIEWMRDRPKGVSTIYEIKGNKDIIVVIPTADFNGKYAKECRENIFKGLHMVFVESGGIGDFYFNHAHNFNVGIKKAMEYNPKWIIYSNDDMKKIDEITILVNQLSELNNERVMTVFTFPSKYHSYHSTIGQERFLTYELLYLFYFLVHHKLSEYKPSYKLRRNIERRFNIKWRLGPRNKVLAKIVMKNVQPFIMTSDFGILSNEWCKKNQGLVFDETYINGVDDWQLSLKLSKEIYAIVNFKIGDMIGATLGTGPKRYLRDIVNKIYFDYSYMNTF